MSCVLETSRLQLRPCQIEDIQLIHTLWTSDRVRSFLFDNRVISSDEAESFVEDSIANFEQHGYGLWLIFMRDLEYLVGFAGFLPSEEGTPSLIYGVHPDRWGYGYATEAASAVLGYALDTLSLPKVRADVDEPNIASVRVLEKLGMRQTGREVVNEHPLLYFEKLRSL
ncbi:MULTISPECIES: GNAT family N-acetyltransferase [unclassified Coleofasciculus]|uniref:GNAT family N-acetyltransferase n=1 Tax=Cyanophyceae TaxID=3028117 RepID=UPI00168826E7|nr:MULTISPECIES: GNAT family N-acetyltransferase [unclassified Coleofasciculus]MBD1891468.1 GNAT family N-acetyltransferase [Coleofasciculus sp. FACHB-SPT9]MBD2538182.1 GNAT family N-acetyltransferase [Coleofasciculus sp. FACHB-SPT36]